MILIFVNRINVCYDCKVLWTLETFCLKEKSLIYKCDCSRKDIKSRMKSIRPGEELCYDSFCRTRQEEVMDSFSYRIKLEEKNYKIDDLYLGALEQTPSRQ